jgi:hypothetical protein
MAAEVVVVQKAKARNLNGTSLWQGVRLASENDETGRVDKGEEPPDVTFARLRAHIAALEQELANYASRYGLTDKARELLARPILG